MMIQHCRVNSKYIKIYKQQYGFVDYLILHKHNQIILLLGFPAKG